MNILRRLLGGRPRTTDDGLPTCYACKGQLKAQWPRCRSCGWIVCQFDRHCGCRYLGYSETPLLKPQNRTLKTGLSSGRLRLRS